MLQSYEKSGVSQTSRAAHYKNLRNGTYSKQQAAIIAILRTSKEPLTAKELAPLVGQMTGKSTTVPSDISCAVSQLKKSDQIVIFGTKMINGQSSNALRLTTAEDKIEENPESDQGTLFGKSNQNEIGGGFHTSMK